MSTVADEIVSDSRLERAFPTFAADSENVFPDTVISQTRAWPTEDVMLGVYNVVNSTDGYNSTTWNFVEWPTNGTHTELAEFSGFDIVAGFIAIIGIVGFLSNGAVVLLFLKFRQLRTPFNMLLLNMSVADLLVSVCGNTLSFASAVKHRWLWGRPGCVWYGFVNHLFGLVSLISLAVISYERYRMVVKPKGPGSSHLTYNKVGLAIFFIYLYCLLWTTLPILGWSSYQLEQGPRIGCSVAWEAHSPSNTSYIVVLFITCLLAPLLLIIYSYARLWYRVKDGSRNLPLAVRKSSQKEQKIARMVVVMITCFMVCWLPYGAMALVVSFGGEKLISPTAAVVPSILAKSSTCYNPVVYFAMNSQFRRYFQDLLCCGRRLFDTSDTACTNATLTARKTTPVLSNGRCNSGRSSGLAVPQSPVGMETQQWIELQTVDVAVIMKDDKVGTDKEMKF